MTTFLIGGGWDASARALVYGPFLESAGSNPTIACVVIDEGDGAAEFRRWAAALTATAPCTPLPVLVPAGRRFDLSLPDDAAALLVCGGHTPSYASALAPAASRMQAWLAEGPRPYAGFSAGAAVAARRALVGGWRVNGRPVCPEDASEDLDEVAVVAGLDLVPFSVDVHATQWGTLERLDAAVRSGRAPSGFAIDEDTMITVEAGFVRVAGLGHAHMVSAAGNDPTVESFGAGETITIIEPA